MTHTVAQSYSLLHLQEGSAVLHFRGVAYSPVVVGLRSMETDPHTFITASYIQ